MDMKKSNAINLSLQQYQTSEAKNSVEFIFALDRRFSSVFFRTRYDILVSRKNSSFSLFSDTINKIFMPTYQ